MKQEYKDGEMTLKDAKELAIKVLVKTLDMAKLTSEKGMYCLYFFKKMHLSFFSVEMATLCHINGKTVIRILGNKEVEELISEYEKSEAAVEASKKEQQQKSTS